MEVLECSVSIYNFSKYCINVPCSRLQVTLTHPFYEFNYF